MTKQKLTYKQAINRVEEILDIVENQEPDVDELAELVKEGTKLISICKEKLRDTETEFNTSLEALDKE